MKATLRSIISLMLVVTVLMMSGISFAEVGTSDSGASSSTSESKEVKEVKEEKEVKETKESSSESDSGSSSSGSSSSESGGGSGSGSSSSDSSSDGGSSSSESDKGSSTSTGGSSSDDTSTTDNNDNKTDTEGGETEGDGTEGDETEGDGTEGDETEGDGTEGDETEGDGTEGDETEGDGTEGDETEGDGTEGDAPKTVQELVQEQIQLDSLVDTTVSGTGTELLDDTVNVVSTAGVAGDDTNENGVSMLSGATSLMANASGIAPMALVTGTIENAIANAIVSSLTYTTTNNGGSGVYNDPLVYYHTASGISGNITVNLSGAYAGATIDIASIQTEVNRILDTNNTTSGYTTQNYSNNNVTALATWLNGKTITINGGTVNGALSLDTSSSSASVTVNNTNMGTGNNNLTVTGSGAITLSGISNGGTVTTNGGTTVGLTNVTANSVTSTGAGTANLSGVTGTNGVKASATAVNVNGNVSASSGTIDLDSTTGNLAITSGMVSGRTVQMNSTSGNISNAGTITGGTGGVAIGTTGGTIANSATISSGSTVTLNANSGSSAINNTGSVSGTTVTLTGAGTGTGGSLTASTLLTINAGGGAVNQTINTPQVKVNNAAAVTLTDVTSGSTATEILGIAANGAVNYTSNNGSALTVSGLINSTNGAIIINNGTGNITTQTSGDITGGTGAVSLTTTGTGVITNKKTVSGSTVTMSAVNDIFNEGAITGTGGGTSVDLDARHITNTSSGTITGTTVDLNATGSITNNGTITGSTSALLTAVTNITGSGVVRSSTTGSGGYVKLTAGNNIGTSETDRFTIDTGKLDLNATNAYITAMGDFSTSGPNTQLVINNAANSVSNDFYLDADRNLEFKNFAAGNDINVKVTGAIDIDNVSAGRDLILEGKSADIYANMSAGRHFSVTTVDPMNVFQDVTGKIVTLRTTGTGSDITLAGSTITATDGDVTLDAKGAIVVNSAGPIIASDAINLWARGGDIANSGERLVVDAPVVNIMAAKNDAFIYVADTRTGETRINSGYGSDTDTSNVNLDITGNGNGHDVILDHVLVNNLSVGVNGILEGDIIANQVTAKGTTTIVGQKDFIVTDYVDSVGTIDIIAEDNILGPGSGRLVSADYVILKAINGSIGEKTDYIQVQHGTGKHLTADAPIDIYIEGTANRNLNLNTITAGNNVGLRVEGIKGSITGVQTQKPNITAKELEMIAHLIGNNHNNPVSMSVDVLSTHGSSAYLLSLKDVVIGKVYQYGRFDLTSTGAILSSGTIASGHINPDTGEGIIRAATVWLASDKNVGEKDVPIWLSSVYKNGVHRDITVTSGNGYGAWYGNLYVKATVPFQPDPRPAVEPDGTTPVEPTETAPNATNTVTQVASNSGTQITLLDAGIPLAAPEHFEALVLDGAVTPVRTFPATVSGESMDPAAVLALTDATADGQANGNLIEWLMNNATFIDAFEMTLGGDDVEPMFRGLLTVSINVGEDYDGQTLYVLASKDGRMTLVACTVEDGIITFMTDSLGMYMILGDWDAFGLDMSEWAMQDNVVTGYLDRTMTSDTTLSADDLSMLDELYRLTMSSQETLALLDANTGTSLTSGITENDTFTAPVLTVTTKELTDVSDLPVADGETMLYAAEVSATDNGNELSMEQGGILVFQLTHAVEDGTQIWFMGADGVWTSQAVAPDANGRIMIPVEAFGTFVITSK